jgi:hypothetical protein
MDAVMKEWKGAFVSLPSGLVVDCEIAATQEERERGFIGRRRPPYGTGILFVFQQMVLTPFTMRETTFPLDLVFMRGEMTDRGHVSAEIVQIVSAEALDLDPIWPSIMYNLCLETTARSPVIIDQRNRSVVISEKRT